MDQNRLFCQRLFSERALETAVKLGVKQAVFFDAKGNMFAYRRPKWADMLSVYELCSRNDLVEKLQRLEEKQLQVPDDTYYIEWYTHSDLWTSRLRECMAFSEKTLTFCDLMGLSGKISKGLFEAYLMELEKLIPSGSSIVFDYYDSCGDAFERGYTYRELERKVSRCGYRIYEHVTCWEMSEQYLRMYNLINENKIVPPRDVSYCLAVKK